MPSRTKAANETVLQESNSGVIELFDDDPDAVEAVLKHIYTDETDCSRSDDWLHQLHVCQAADKYLLPKLSSAAFTRFKQATDDLKDMSSVLEAIQTIRDISNDEEHTKIADSLEARHQSALLRHDDYRSIVENDKALMWKHMDRLNFDDDVEAMEFVKCQQCRKSAILPVGSDLVSSCGYYSGHVLDRTGLGLMSKSRISSVTKALGL